MLLLKYFKHLRLKLWFYFNLFGVKDVNRINTIYPPPFLQFYFTAFRKFYIYLIFEIKD
jgi:hypothetical protein